jgi:hypothetical protein
MSTGGRHSHDKSNRTERALVRVLQQQSFAERIPLSGGAGGRFAGDITVPLLAQVKVRADAFSEPYAWLNEGS